MKTLYFASILQFLVSTAVSVPLDLTFSGEPEHVVASPYDDEEVSLTIKGWQGHIHKHLLSGLKDIKNVQIASSDIRWIEDGALCASPFERIDLFRSSVPKLTSNFFGWCPTIRTLTVISNGKSDIAIEESLFSRLPNLEILRLFGLRHVTLGHFENLSNLRELAIGNCSLGAPLKLTSGVLWKIPHLEYLSLSGCNIESVQKGALIKLGKLKYLNLARNSLEDFPWNDLNYLKELEFLDVSYNKLTQLQPEKLLASLPKLGTFKHQANCLNCTSIKHIQRVFNEPTSLQTHSIIIDEWRCCDTCRPLAETYPEQCSLKLS